MIDCLLMFDTSMLLNIEPISLDLRWCAQFIINRVSFLKLCSTSFIGREIYMLQKSKKTKCRVLYHQVVEYHQFDNFPFEKVFKFQM
jgi:hypothetical protein